MGLDIYAGTLVRYYAQNWESVVQKWAKANGYQFTRVTSGGEAADKERPELEDVMAAVGEWQQAIGGFLTGSGLSFHPWAEDNTSPYYTDKPDWDAFGALLLFGACRYYGEPLPPTVEKGWNFFLHPVVKRAIADPELNWSLYSGAELWLPLEGCYSFSGVDPSHKQRTISTAESLLMELSQINTLSWNADEETILSWADTEGYPVNPWQEADPGQIGDGSNGSRSNNSSNDSGISNGGAQTYDTESLAKFALSILFRAGLFAAAHHVPVLMDY